MIGDYLEALALTLARVPRQPIEQIVALLKEARREGNRLFVMGNGGSAATAAHFVNDLVKGTAVPGRPCFRAMCLSDNVSTLTAYANDLSYDAVFSEPLRAFGDPGDLAMALSASGNSPNVLRAMEAAAELGIKRIGLCGFEGGRLRAKCDVCVVVPSEVVQIVEDAHLAILHSAFLSLQSMGGEIAASNQPNAGSG